MHRQWLFFAEFIEFVRVLGGPCFISCAADGSQADEGDCEAVENSEEEEANAGAKRSRGSAYEREGLKNYPR